MDPADIEIEKIEQLRASLAEAVRAARQLGVDTDDAVREYRELLEENDEEKLK